jgi:hypothetical protein
MNSDGLMQRVLNDLHRGPGFFAVLRFDSSPNPLLPSVSSTETTQEDWDKSLKGEGEGVGDEPNHTTRESLVVYQSFNTLWVSDECLSCFADPCINSSLTSRRLHVDCSLVRVRSMNVYSTSTVCITATHWQSNTGSIPIPGRSVQKD